MGLKQILIIHPEGNAGNNPTVKCLIDLLVKLKFQVTYFSSENSKFKPLMGVNFILRSAKIEKIKRKLFNKYCLIKISKIFSCLRNLHLYKKYDLIISVDREGLIEGAALSNFFRVPLVHMSFEILFKSETFNKFKQIEINASKQISWWIIQDKIRANSLSEENHLTISKAMIIPLASEDAGEISKERLRDDIGIPTKKKVAIFMGSLYRWTMIEELIEQLNYIPEDWAIIIHERYGETNKYLSNYSFDYALRTNKIYVSNFSVENVDKMGYVLSGVDVGLAFYKPTYDDPTSGLNLEYLGMASGKISTYLRYGIPTIINEIGFYADLSRKYEFGLVINDIKELPISLTYCENKMQYFSQNAKIFFSSNLDFNLYKNNLISKIDELIY